MGKVSKVRWARSCHSSCINYGLWNLFPLWNVSYFRLSLPYKEESLFKMFEEEDFTWKLYPIFTIFLFAYLYINIDFPLSFFYYLMLRSEKKLSNSFLVCSKVCTFWTQKPSKRRYKQQKHILFYYLSMLKVSHHCLDVNAIEWLW